jgi:hypothetical protein
MRSGDKIEADVLEVSEMEIKYKEFNYPDGPVHIINPSSVYMIRYQNGTEQFFEQDRHDPKGKQWVDKQQYYKNGNNQYFASFAVGHGPSYGWIGLRYQGRVGKELGFGWHAGGGFFPKLFDIDNTYLMYSGGLKFFFYRGMYVDVQYGTFLVVNDYQYVEYYSYEKEVVLHGPTFTVGGDWFFNRYIGLNGGFGFSYDVNTVLNGPNVFPAVEVGVICKW